jgi:hypothetical protein
MRHLLLELDVLTPAERRDLANAPLHTARTEALAETRVLLLDMSVAVDVLALGEAA